MRQSQPVQVKHIQIGGGAPVVIQSMTKTDTADVGATVAQIEEMVRAGCEIVRLAVPDNDAAVALKEIRKRVPDVPLVADIHFHYKLALMALEAGIDKLASESGQHRRARTHSRSCACGAIAEGADSHWRQWRFARERSAQEIWNGDSRSDG